jgi:hypothetical protein
VKGLDKTVDTHLIRDSRWKNWEQAQGYNPKYLITFNVGNEGPSDFQILRDLASFTLSLLIVLTTSKATNKAQKKFFDVFGMADIFQPWLRAYRWSRDNFVDFTKYITVYPLARSIYVVSELPIVPEGFSCSPVFFEGRLRRMIMNRVQTHYSIDNGSFLFSWQMCKKGTNKVPEEFIMKAMVKHSKTLSTPFGYTQFMDEEEKGYPTPECMSQDDRLELEELHLEAIEVMDVLVNGIIPPNTDLNLNHVQDIEASTSASYEYKRSEGGARGYIRSLCEPNWCGANLARMGYHPRCGVWSVYDDLTEIPDFDFLMKRALPTAYEETTIQTDSGPIHWQIPTIYDNVPFSAKVACVLEPLKVRVLTKCEAVPQHLCRPLQKFLWNSLVQFPCFHLIGKTVDTMDIDDMLELASINELGNWKEFSPDSYVANALNSKFWKGRLIVSGDYSAATDGLNPFLSFTLMEKICERLHVPHEYMVLCQKVLGNQEIEYPDSSGLPPITQVRGQLMGSILSFPILCMLNSLTYILAHTETRKKFLEAARQPSMSHPDCRRLVAELPILINGDDILFTSDMETYQRWCRILKHIGFNRSLGKNLVSHRICTINSTLFSIRRDQPYGKRVTKAKIMNVGLLMGQSKCNNANKKPTPIWDIHNMVMDNTDNVHLATKLFLYFNRDKIDEITRGGKYNLYLPRSLGGCGFEGRAKTITPYQRALGTYLLHRHENLGVVMDEDLGLVQRSVKPLCVHRDPYATVLGKRVRAYDVPPRGYIRKPEPIEDQVPNGTPFPEDDIETRFPINIPGPIYSLEDEVTLYQWTDRLKTIIKVGSTHEPCGPVVSTEEGRELFE